MRDSLLLIVVFDLGNKELHVGKSIIKIAISYVPSSRWHPLYALMCNGLYASSCDVYAIDVSMVSLVPLLYSLSVCVQIPPPDGALMLPYKRN